jgi:hypothetical protein
MLFVVTEFRKRPLGEIDGSWPKDSPAGRSTCEAADIR